TRRSSSRRYISRLGRERKNRAQKSATPTRAPNPDNSCSPRAGRLNGYVVKNADSAARNSRHSTNSGPRQREAPYSSANGSASIGSPTTGSPCQRPSYDSRWEYRKLQPAGIPHSEKNSTTTTPAPPL